jgi:hypothetical protein
MAEGRWHRGRPAGRLGEYDLGQLGWSYGDGMAKGRWQMGDDGPPDFALHRLFTDDSPSIHHHFVSPLNPCQTPNGAENRPQGEFPKPATETP